MKKQIATLFAATLVLATSCEKEKMSRSSAKPDTLAGEPSRNRVYYEGIKSYDYYNSSSNEAMLGFYCFYGPSVGQYPQLAFPVDYPDNTVFAYAATTGHEAVVYRNTSNIQEISSSVYGSNLLTVNNGANFFYSPIEEVEFFPGSNDVYAIAKSGNGKAAYRIDATTGYVTPLTVNGGAYIFSNTTGNGYKSGSISFVPDGNGSYELVFSSESTVYASSGVLSWHFNISGNNLVSNVPHHRSYTGIPGTGAINTTYGNGKLYFSRNGNGTTYGGSNAVYSLSLTSNTSTLESFTVKNINDFGYWKSY